MGEVYYFSLSSPALPLQRIILSAACIRKRRSRNSPYFGAYMRSLQRQRKMYVDGFAGIKPAIPVSYTALVEQAKQRLSAEAFACLAGGAGNETTIRANQTAPEQVKIHPHMLGGVQEVSMNLKWRASTLPAPFTLLISHPWNNH